MPAFIFLGGPECGDVDCVVMFGIALPLGVPVEVTEAHAAQKLRGNMFFREVEAVSAAPSAEVEEAGAPAASAEGDQQAKVTRRGRPRRV
jgi:hypothetical protein